MSKTMFGEAKSQKYADIVKLDTVDNARISISKLKSEFRRAKTRSKQVRVKRVTVNASNRALASAKRRQLSYSERIEFSKIGSLYSKAGLSMVIPARDAKKR